MDKAPPEWLAEIPLFWQEAGFEPWTWKDFKGVKRRVTFRKGALLGEVARYYADDHIVWHPPAPGGENKILADWRPADEVMSHRFLILDGCAAVKPLKKYYLLGIRGWLEVLPYSLGGPEVDGFRDLIFIANKAWEYSQKLKGGDAGGNA